MKGFIIFEDFKKLINCKEILDGNYNCVISDYPEGTFSGVINRVTRATCNKEDTYDFETGALIALMKMCGREKALKAVEELYNLKEPRGADLDGDILISTYEEAISEAADALTELNDKYGKAVDGLKKAKELDELREKHIKELEAKFNKKVSDLRDQIHENSRLIQTKGELLDRVNYWKSQVNRLCSEKHRLKEENEKLKLDCEKLQHGYIDTDMMFCGGRQNGKQHTFLVDLFKKIDQKKVDAAYKEAYNTKIPVWQKEVFKQMCDIYEESKDKTVQIKGFNINIKPSTKREKMWNDILACDCEHSKYVKVKKEDLETFAKECNEKKIFSISGYEFHLQKFWFGYSDDCIFQIFRKPAGFICATDVSFTFKDTILDYLPPMRWDLFKKGRISVKVTFDNYHDFYDACEKELGRKPCTMFCGDFTVSICKKDGNFEVLLIEDQKKKIVDWEDVR